MPEKWEKMCPAKVPGVPYIVVASISMSHFIGQGISEIYLLSKH